MASVSKTILLGNLGKDPEVKTFDWGTACNFTIATTEKWTTKAGEKKEETTWHNISCTGKTAENCGKYLKKGSSVFIEGKISNRMYEKDGEKKYFSEIKTTSVTFLGGKSDVAQGNNVAQVAPNQSQNNNDVDEIDPDELPF